MSMRSTIICVDDDKWVLDVLVNLLNEFLGKNYTIEKALSGTEALEIIDDCVAEGEDVCLVISDYIMPVMKGDEFLEQVKAKSPLTRRIMLTGFAAIEGITNAINKASIYRFMSKPWDNKDMMLTVLQAIRSYEQDKQNEKLATSHKELYHKFQSLALTLQTNLKSTVETLSMAIDIRDSGMPGHSKRVAECALKIAERLEMSKDDMKVLETSAMLHDIGKLALKDEEVEAIQGLRCYSKTDIALRQSDLAKLILAKMDEKILPGIIFHTERVDGQGPYKKNQHSMPIEAKIIGIANYFETVRSSRPNDNLSSILSAMSPDKGKIFDAELFDILVKTSI